MTDTMPYRMFRVEVDRVDPLSPSFLRVTFTGADLGGFADNGRDQRIKLVFPAPDSGYDDLPYGADWYARWRALPARRQAPVRTYTVRAVRADRCEVDVDMVLHGDGGPASRWAGRARPGDPMVLIGPNAGFDGDHGGVAFHPPAGARLLLAGDETAAPAVASILAGLPATARGTALLEVPDTADALRLEAPDGVTVTWLARAADPHGTLLVPAVVAALDGTGPTPVGPPEAVTGDDDEILWDVPDDGAGTDGIYAWLAGEAGVIRTLRRHLVSERGVDRRSVAFMGYWRIGRAEAT